MTDASGAIVSQFHPFGEEYRGSGSMFAADVGADGVEEIIVGSGPGLSPLVKIYRQDGSMINEFLAYAETYKNGINVAACDLNGDGSNEIVTGTMFGGGPHVRIFSPEGYLLYGGGFFAYDGNFRGGVNVSCGDVNGDGVDEIVTGPGTTGGPHVRVFDAMGNLKFETFAGSASENTGASVATGDLNGDGDDEIIAGRIGAGDSTVMAFDVKKSILTFLVAFNTFDDNLNGIRVTAGDVDGDGSDEIGVTTNRDEVGRVKFFETSGAIVNDFKPFNDEVEKGVVATTLDTGASDVILSMSSTASSSDQVGKYIKVDISEQRLYAYENGVEVKSFLVSTGTYTFPTPLGTSEVYEKLLWHDYTWNYGPGNPNNYSLPDVKYNLRIRQHIYIHNAYWHNNFGHRMSHGCVNVNLENSEWIYNWAEVGTPVEVVE